MHTRHCLQLQGGDWKQLETRKLTKLERANLEAAKTRHRDGIAAPKVGGLGMHVSVIVILHVNTQTYTRKHLHAYKEGIVAPKVGGLGIYMCGTMHGCLHIYKHTDSGSCACPSVRCLTTCLYTQEKKANGFGHLLYYTSARAGTCIQSKARTQTQTQAHTQTHTHTHAHTHTYTHIHTHTNSAGHDGKGVWWRRFHHHPCCGRVQRL